MQRASHVAADIRRPLAGMIELADLLLESGLTERQRGYAAGLRKAAAELLRRIEAAFEPAAGEREAYEFHVGEALRTAIACCSGLAHSKQAQVSASVDPGLPETVVADGRRLVYIVAEMIGLALAGGRPATVQLSGAADMLVVEVGPVYDGADLGFASEIAAVMGGAVGVERSADGGGRYVARVARIARPDVLIP